MPATTPSTRAETRRAMLVLVGSAVLFGVMAVCVKVASRRISGAQTALVRSSVGVLATGIALALGRISIRPRRWGWLLTRGVFGGVAVLAYFECIQHVPVGVATLLNYTFPVYAMLFSWVLLGERPRRTAIAALLLALTGTALVVRARVLELHAGGWEAAGVLSAIASGLAVTSIRAARRRVAGGPPAETAWSVFFSFTLFGVLVTLPTVIPPVGRWVTPTPAEWGWLATVGLLSVAAQLLMSHALQHVNVATSGIIHELTVVVAMGIGVLWLGEPLTVASLLGSVLTIAGVAWATVAASGITERSKT